MIVLTLVNLTVSASPGLQPLSMAVGIILIVFAEMGRFAHLNGHCLVRLLDCKNGKQRFSSTRVI